LIAKANSSAPDRPSARQPPGAVSGDAKITFKHVAERRLTRKRLDAPGPQGRPFGARRESWRTLDKFFDLDHPFFRPLWLRMVIVAGCLGWACVELAGGAPGWAILFGAVGIYAAYRFFVRFNPRDKP
jgi:hypothetical protein